MLGIDVDALLRGLAARRPLFHSEADFQHELAWDIRCAAPGLGLRLEQPFPGRTGAIDLVLDDGGVRYGIELKYLRRPFRGTVNGETFDLKGSTPDFGRYDCCKDVQRMEEFARQPGATASVIVLTNDPLYWTANPDDRSSHREFDISHDRDLCGLLSWTAAASPSALKNRGPIQLASTYKLRWQEYSQVEGRYGHFRYLHVPIVP